MGSSPRKMTQGTKDINYSHPAAHDDEEWNKWQYHRIPPAGLVNSGNSCYMNAALQFMMAARPFAYMFREAAGSIQLYSYSKERTYKYAFNEEMIELVQKMTNERRKRCVTARHFRRVAAYRHAEFSGYGQEDSLEYFLHLLTKIQDNFPEELDQWNPCHKLRIEMCEEITRGREKPVYVRREELVLSCSVGDYMDEDEEEEEKSDEDEEEMTHPDRDCDNRTHKTPDTEAKVAGSNAPKGSDGGSGGRSWINRTSGTRMGNHSSSDSKTTRKADDKKTEGAPTNKQCKRKKWFAKNTTQPNNPSGHGTRTKAPGEHHATTSKTSRAPKPPPPNTSNVPATTASASNHGPTHSNQATPQDIHNHRKPATMDSMTAHPSQQPPRQVDEKYATVGSTSHDSGPPSNKQHGHRMDGHSTMSRSGNSSQPVSRKYAAMFQRRYVQPREIHVDLNECIANFMQKESILCENSETLYKMPRIAIFPEYLVVQLRTFVVDKYGTSVKLNVHARVPPILHMAAWACDKKWLKKCNPEIKQKDSGEHHATSYRLKAFVTHLGFTPYGGHYICHVRYNQEWYRYDDSYVVALGEKVPPTKRGYFFLYERMDVDGRHRQSKEKWEWELNAERERRMSPQHANSQQYGNSQQHTNNQQYENSQQHASSQQYGNSPYGNSSQHTNTGHAPPNQHQPGETINQTATGQQSTFTMKASDPSQQMTRSDGPNECSLPANAKPVEVDRNNLSLI